MYKVLVKIKSDNFVSHNEMNRRELYDTEKKNTTRDRSRTNFLRADLC